MGLRTTTELFHISPQQILCWKNLNSVKAICFWQIGIVLWPLYCILLAMHFWRDARQTMMENKHLHWLDTKPESLNGAGQTWVLPFPTVFSATSRTTRSPSRLEMGRPRSKGSDSPLCTNTHKDRAVKKRPWWRHHHSCLSTAEQALQSGPPSQTGAGHTWPPQAWGPPSPA